MTRRIPVIPTLVVLAAVATMIALGFWQLDRARERDAMQVRIAERVDLPPVAFPFDARDPEAYLYRRVIANCDRVTGWQSRAGESTIGKNGWREIATCIASGHEQPFLVDAGVAAQPGQTIAWNGGEVSGRAVRAPDTRGPLERLTQGRPATRLMIVAETPAPGLAASRQPDASEEVNSSWSYMVQWFLFALTALVIYALALVKRGRSSGA